MVLRYGISPHPEHLHHFVAQVVDDLDGDAARGRLAPPALVTAGNPSGNSFDTYFFIISNVAIFDGRATTFFASRDLYNDGEYNLSG